MRTLTPQELKELRTGGKVTLLDVREAEEWDIVHLPGSVHIPMREIPQRLDEIGQLKSIVVVCHHGVRSEMAARFLEQNGIGEVSHLAGGLDAWAVQIDTGMPRY